MDHLTEEIIAQVKRAKTWGKDVNLSDFQIRVTHDAIFLVHLTTGRTFKIPEDGAEPIEVTNYGFI